MSQWFLSSEVGKKPEITNGEPSSSRRFGSSIRTNSGLGSTKFESLTSVNSFNSHIKYDWDVQTPRLRKVQSNFQRHEVQFLHERRKLEKEATDLRKRLALLIDKATPNWNKGQKTNKQSCSPTGLSMSQWFLSSEVGKKPEITNGEPSSSRRFGSSIRTNSGLGSTKFESLTSVNSFNSHIKYDWDVQTPRVCDSLSIRMEALYVHPVINGLGV
uniref:Uncharacterized protein n=1 Tax=Schistosoma mansoni TaxID=6183 RepID=A0A5K4F5H3_SCHMA